MFVVFKRSPGGCRGFIRFFEHEIDAADYCDVRDWELLDENGFLWDLDYCEAIDGMKFDC